MLADERVVTGAERALRLADVESERMAAFIRVAIFAAILAAVLVAQSAGFDHRPLVVATATYGAGTLIALALALRRIFARWLPYAFVAMDMATLGFTIQMLGRTMELSAGLAVTLPVGGLVFLVLAHASMHYRPLLVLFAAIAFVVSLTASGYLPAVPAFPPHVHSDATDHLQHFRLYPAAIFILATAILFFTSHRTRRFINESFAHASRAATLSRYFAPEVVAELTRRPVEAASFGERMQVAVIFADIRGFTALAEAMDPADVAQFVSEFRRRVAAPAIAHGGIVDKYIGDAIMVVFGAPAPRGHDPKRALQCALAMAQAMTSWSAERQRHNQTPVAVGIGAHFGTAFAGVLSDGRQLEYTVIGDTVNVASRLAGLLRVQRTQLFVSDELATAGGGLPADEDWQRLTAQSLPGHPRPLTVFQCNPRSRPG